MASKNKKQINELGGESQKKLKKLLCTLATHEIDLELKRQYLSHNENMQPYDLFQRIDRSEDGFINPMELLNYLRDNGIHDVCEADCYYIVKFFDSDEDGLLGFMDFSQMILPADAPAIKAAATQRPEQRIGPKDYLTLDVERDLTNLLMGEVKMHRKTEDLKQELSSMADYSDESLYKSIDDWGYGFVD
jgi:hypothetical protein